MLNSTQHIFGDLTVIVYDFLKGDELELHTHDKNSEHISVVANGDFNMLGGSKELPVQSGNIVDFFEGQYHGFLCTSDKGRIVAVRKYIQ
jgi:quercetin dioxygenase-like cupin family protein